MQKTLAIAVLTGALFAQVPSRAATPVLSPLFSFGYGNGASPEAGLVLNNGSLYGTTYAGGSSGWGAVFVLGQSGGTWTFHELYSFSGGADGANPRAGVIFSSRGVIFGTTEQGGAYNNGTVFTLTPAGGGKWTEAVIYSFTGQNGDGANPEASLLLSPKGVLYGTTTGGGATGNGTVFSLTPAAGGAWTEQVVYSFGGAPSNCGTTGPACDGAFPLSSLFMTGTGQLYGTTYTGTGIPGAPGWGTVYQLTPVGGGSYTEKVIYSFLGAPSGVDGGQRCGTSGQPACDGGAPAGPLVLNKNTGAFYGTTTLGGNPIGCPLGGYVQGCGAVFQLLPPVPPGTTWTESVIWAFGGAPRDGTMPADSLSYPVAGGAIYGTTFYGGNTTANCFPASFPGCGIVYVLRPPVAPSITWTKTTLGTFDGDSGGGPNGVIMSPTGGILYGTAYLGGLAGGYGTAFQQTFGGN